MFQQGHDVDVSSLVDVISNVAGMMIMLACVALVVQQKTTPEQAESYTKPIAFPLAYIPTKRSLTLCIKYGRLYTLPERELLEAVAERTVTGEATEWLSLTHDGVEGEIQLTPTVTGFRFQFRLLPDGGLPLMNSTLVTTRLQDLIHEFPPDRFFYVVHVWPGNDGFMHFRNVREYLHEHNVEVGWAPIHPAIRRPHDVAYSIGEYDENLSSIKAQ